VVNVEVELLERPPKFRVLANLRTDWDPVTGRRLMKCRCGGTCGTNKSDGSAAPEPAKANSASAPISTGSPS
jgi:hypothetical protein